MKRRTFLSAILSTAASLLAAWKVKANFAVFQVNGTTIVQADWYANVNSGVAASTNPLSPGGLTEAIAAAVAAGGSKTIALFPCSNAVSYAARTISAPNLTFKSARVRNPITNHPLGVPGRSTLCPPDAPADCLAAGMAQVDTWQISADNVILDNLYFQLSQWPGGNFGTFTNGGVIFQADQVGPTTIRYCRIRHGRSPGYDGTTSPTIALGTFTAHDNYDPNTFYPEYNAIGIAGEPSRIHNNLADGIQSTLSKGIIITDCTVTDCLSAFNLQTSATNAVGAVVIDRNLSTRIYFHQGAYQWNLPASSVSYSWNVHQQPIGSTLNFVDKAGCVLSTGSATISIANTSGIEYGMFVIDQTNDPHNHDPSAPYTVQNSHSGSTSLLKTSATYFYPRVTAVTPNVSVTLSDNPSGNGTTTLRFVGDANASHSSLYQAFAAAGVSANQLNFVTVGNISFVGNSHGNLTDMAGILLEQATGGATGIFDAPIIRGNVCINNVDFGHQIGAVRNSLIFGNTSVHNTPVDPPNYNLGGSNIVVLSNIVVDGNNLGAPAGFQYMSHNIAEIVNGGSGGPGTIAVGAAGNTQLGLNGTQGPAIPYFYNGSTGVFAGPNTFQPQTVADVLSMYSLANTGAYPNQGAIGTGYVNFATMTIDTTMEPTLAIFGVALTGQIANTVIQSPISIIRGGPNGRTATLTQQFGSAAAVLQMQITSDFAGANILHAFTSGGNPNGPFTVDEGQYIQVRITSDPVSLGQRVARVTFTGAGGTTTTADFSVQTA